MVTIVKSSRSIRRTLLYNEQKVEENKALLLDARNYWQEKEDLSFEEKMHRLKDLTLLNERCKAHCIHISVNFHPVDQLTDKEMVRIAAEFMKDIDFKDQPWLVYRHIDAGHPHCHVVSTNIRHDGSRIPNDLRSPYLLKQLCQRIEWAHGLTHAQMPVRRKTQTADYAQKLKYGETSTKEGIANVLRHTLDKYAYTSLEHLNSLLSLYHVRADRGSTQGLMYQNRGLYYRMIDAEGKKVGAPIKASAFESQPTLNNLEQKFILNAAKEAESIRHVERHVLWAMRPQPPASLANFREELRTRRIVLVIPALTQRPTRREKQTSTPAPAQSATSQTHNPQSLPDDGHGFFFIDLTNAVILRDTQLGPRCTAEAILQRCQLDQTIPTLLAQGQLTPDKNTERLLQSSDNIEKRNILLRLTPKHDQWQAKQEAQQETQRQSHRMRISF